MRCLISLIILFSYCSSFSQINKTGTSLPDKEYSSLAQYPGGEDSLKRFIGKNFHNPDSIPFISVTKKGKVKFVVLIDGTTGSFEILERVGYKYDEEIIRLIKLTKWVPATEKGRPIEQIETLDYTVVIDEAEN